MSYNFIKFDQDATREEKISILEQNERVLKSLKHEINNPSMGIIVKAFKESTKEDKIEKSPIPKKDVSPASNDFMRFFDQLLVLPINDDFRERLFELLDPSDFRFNNFISLSKLKIYESIVLLSNMCYEDKNISVQETLDYVHNLQSLLAILDEVMEEKELVEESSSHLNDLFFFQNGDKIPFVESVDKEVAPEYYERIGGILEDLRRGYLGNFKYLGDKKFFEVRSDLVRVFFSRIGPNNFLILDTFLKKKKSSTEYWDRMYTLKDALIAVKSYYSGIVNNEEEKQRHLDYYMDILKMLNSKKRGG